MATYVNLHTFDRIYSARDLGAEIHKAIAHLPEDQEFVSVQPLSGISYIGNLNLTFLMISKDKVPDKDERIFDFLEAICDHVDILEGEKRTSRGVRAGFSRNTGGVDTEYLVAMFATGIIKTRRK